MLLAELTILLCFHSIWMKLLILSHIIITLLALFTSKSYLDTHDVTSIDFRKLMLKVLYVTRVYFRVPAGITVKCTLKEVRIETQVLE